MTEGTGHSRRSAKRDNKGMERRNGELQKVQDLEGSLDNYSSEEEATP